MTVHTLCDPAHETENQNRIWHNGAALHMKRGIIVDTEIKLKIADNH